jgi:predicted transcriptional regulator
VLVPHPDDVEAVREGLDQAERGEVLSVEESADYLRSLTSDERPAK